MRKDIEIPEVKDVEIAAVLEWNEDFMQDTWYAYLFNNTPEDLEAILITSQAKGEIDGEPRQSSLFRHAFPKLNTNQSLKIELLDEAIFQLDNEFMLSFFSKGTLFDKKYILKAGSITKESISTLKNSEKKGILAM